MAVMSNRPTDAAPSSCPRCLKGDGQPFRLAHDAESSVRVLLRCDLCHHRWSTIVDADHRFVTGNAQLWIKK
jgi:hypothetical protein